MNGTAVSFHHHHLRFTDQLDLQTGRPDVLHVLHASGRGTGARIPANWTSLWVPLSGELHMQSGFGDWQIQARSVLVWRDGGIHGSGHSQGAWLCLAGPHSAWAKHMYRRGGPEILPWQSRNAPQIRRLMVRIARSMRMAGRPAPETVERHVETLCAALIEQQRPLHRYIDRCSGRTLQRRQQTFLRLLRVRHMIRNRLDDRIELAHLADIANYSPWHLIRIYRQVFDETPAEYAARLRTEQAWSMVLDTQLPICEITEALGFDSQSAFCRAFKRSYGLTTTQARNERDITTQLAA